MHNYEILLIIKIYVIKVFIIIILSSICLFAYISARVMTLPVNESPFMRALRFKGNTISLGWLIGAPSLPARGDFFTRDPAECGCRNIIAPSYPEGSIICVRNKDYIILRDNIEWKLCIILYEIFDKQITYEGWNVTSYSSIWDWFQKNTWKQNKLKSEITTYSIVVVSWVH